MEYNIKETDSASYITLNNDCGLSVTLCNIGASIYDASLKGYSLVMSPTEEEDFLYDKAYFGKTIGPISGRIKDCIVAFDVKGSDKPKVCRLDQNEGKNTLHSGHYGYNKHKFEYEIIEEDASILVVFKFTTLQGYTGLPGIEDIQITYRLHKNQPILRVDMIIKNSDTTVLNPTNHTYWNLGGERNILDHTLKIPADKYVTYSKHLVPMAIMDVNKINDWRDGKYIGQDIEHYSLYLTNAKGYDTYYMFNDGNVGINECKLESKKISMTCRTNRFGVHVYTYNYPVEGRELTSGLKEEKYSGVALEFMENPLTTGKTCVNDAGTSKVFWNEYTFEFNE